MKYRDINMVREKCRTLSKFRSLVTPMKIKLYIYLNINSGLYAQQANELGNFIVMLIEATHLYILQGLFMEFV